MAAMSFSVPARVGNARGALSSRRAASAARAPRVRPARPARQGLKVEATVSKDNVFAKNPGSLEALNNLTVDSARAGSPPLTSASAPDDFSTMPHRERLKVFSGSAHPELSDVRALFQTSDSRFFRKTRRGDSGPAGARRRQRVARGDARARTGGTSRSIARSPVPPRARVAARSSADPFSWSNASVQKFGIPSCLEMGVRPRSSDARLAPPTLTARRSSLSFAPFTLSPQEIANYLGMDLGGRVIKKFADGEVYVQIQESIRGCDVFLVQPTCPPNVNDNLMELLIMIDACRRASCRSITCVIPYYGYARADRRTSGRESIAAKLAANLLTEAGATRIVMLDIHSLQTIGYFDIPVDHIYGETVILDYLTSKDFDPDDLVVVSPDVGGVPRARAFAKKLCDAPLAIIDKRRTGHNKAEVMNLIGEVDGKVAIVLDDMIDTGGTICAGAKMLRERGAKEVYACATHAVFSPPAVERLGSGVFTEVIVTNSIPHVPERDFPQLTVLSVGNLLGETIWRVHNDTPVSFNKL